MRELNLSMIHALLEIAEKSSEAFIRETAFDALAEVNQAPPINEAVSILVRHFHERSRAAGWWLDPNTKEDLRANPYVIATKLLLIHSEISEATEHHRRGTNDDKLPHRNGVEVELADALIRILDLAGALNLDLGGATAEKDSFNGVRPDHKIEARVAKGGKLY